MRIHETRENIDFCRGRMDLSVIYQGERWLLMESLPGRAVTIVIDRLLVDWCSACRLAAAVKRGASVHRNS
jgi:hypothetical protein